MTPEQLANETEQKDELLFVLHHRDAPTVAFLECNSYAKREELALFLQENLTEYQFHNIDVTRFSIISLLRVLTENLPPEIINSEPVQYIVNVYGLENSLLVSEDGQIKPSLLTAQLNLERELLFRNVPYIIIIWADHFFFQTLQRESPDLWSWVVYRFRFEGAEAVDPENAPPLPPERLPQRGNIAERQKRIQELETTYNQLNLDTSDKKRLLKDKVTILKLLGEEYAEAFQYDEAQTSYENAIAIAERMQEGQFIKGELLYRIASLYHRQSQFGEALLYYNKCLEMSLEWNYIDVYQSIGRLHYELHQWKQAIYNYHEAIDWSQKTDNLFQISQAYHGLGMTYNDLKKWDEALQYYQKALEWEEKFSNKVGMGMTYHEMGVTFHDLGHYEAALHYYRLSIKCKEEIEDFYNIGVSYHQIGLLYENNKSYDDALQNYYLSIEWNEKSGNEFGVGRSYHHIGCVLQAKERWVEAFQNLKLALNWKGYTKNEVGLGVTLYQLGNLLETQNKIEEAVNWYTQALSNLILFNNPHRIEVEQRLRHLENHVQKFST